MEIAITHRRFVRIGILRRSVVSCGVLHCLAVFRQTHTSTRIRSTWATGMGRHTEGTSAGICSPCATDMGCAYTLRTDVTLLTPRLVLVLVNVGQRVQCELLLSHLLSRRFSNVFTVLALTTLSGSSFQ